MVSEFTKEFRQARSHLSHHAKTMRREPTAAELRFWYEVRDRRLGGLKFRRQVPIGRYIADYLCTEHRLIVEIDGGQHCDNPRDAAREAELKKLGYRVLRFWNVDVLQNKEGVCETILRAVGKL